MTPEKLRKRVADARRRHEIRERDRTAVFKFIDHLEAELSNLKRLITETPSLGSAMKWRRIANERQARIDHLEAKIKGLVHPDEDECPWCIERVQR